MRPFPSIPSIPPRSRGFAAALAVLALAGGSLRLVAVPPLLPDLDSVNFARALKGVDLAAQAPHFPGYPVYVVATRAFDALGFAPVWALSLPGALLSVAATALLGAALRRALGALPALAGSAIVSLAPLPVLAGGAPASDGAGFAALVIAVAAVACSPPRLGHAGAGGLLAGLALGVRPSYLPAVAPLFFALPKGSRAAWALGLSVGAAAWLLPLAALTGPARLGEIAVRFVAGHATEWGGTAAVHSGLLDRGALFLFDLGPVGLGTPGLGAHSAARIAVAALLSAPLAALALAGARRCLPPAALGVARSALLVGIPYAAWAFVGQNLLKARHVLPLILVAALLVAAGAWVLAHRPLRVVLAAGLAAALVAVAWPLAREQGRAPSPAAQLLSFVAGSISPSGAMLFTGEEARLFEHYAPHYRTARPAAGQLPGEAERLVRAGVDVYVTSAAPGASSLEGALTPVARFACSRLVRTHGSEVVLYRYAAEGSAR